MQQNRMFYNISNYSPTTGRATLLSLKFFARFIVLGSTVLFLSISSVKAAIVSYDEAGDGDLYNQIFHLDSVGINTFSGETMTSSGSTDSDTFSVTLAAGLQITDYAVVWSDVTSSGITNIDFRFNLLSEVFSPPPFSTTTLLENSTYSTSADTASGFTPVSPAYSGAHRYIVGYSALGSGELSSDWLGTASYEISIQTETIPVVTHLPVPAAFWLFGTALLGFVGMARKTKI